MTTPAAAALYLAQHKYEHEGKGWAVFNPHSKPVAELPAIYGFNNGGAPGFMYACLVAESGHGMGGHMCSHEGYMPHDLGILEGSRPDRHEGFRKHYPDGYRMVFVSGDPRKHEGLMAAVERGNALPADAEAKVEAEAP